MKTTIRQFTAGTFIALLLLAVYVKASATEIKTLNTDSIEAAFYNEEWIADEMPEDINNLKIAEVAGETVLELEDWMFSEESLNFELNYVEAKDMDLELKGWMINKNSGFTNVVTEPELRVEPWMLKE